MGTGDFPTNLRRLVFFHHDSARDAARVLGVTEHALGAWLSGKREPATKNLFRIAHVYDVDPAKLAGDPLTFAQVLAWPDRIRRAEETIAFERRATLRAVDKNFSSSAALPRGRKT